MNGIESPASTAGRHTRSVSGRGSPGDDSPGSLVFVSQQFPPDKSGHASRIQETAGALAREGWEVTVLAPPPSFPHGDFDRTWKRVERGRVDDVESVRLWSWQPTEPDPAFLSRLSYYVTFAFHAVLWLLSNRERYDVVVTTTPPISTGLPGLIASLLGKLLVVDVRDLWIDASVSLGFISEGGLLERLSRRFQRRVLHTAERICVTTQTLGDELVSQYGSDLGEKLIHLPNGVALSELESETDGGVTVADETDGVVSRASTGASCDPGVEREQRTEREGPVEGTIIYTGNIGHAQDLERCIEALQHLPESVDLRLVGGGDSVPTLRERAAELDLLDRVEFYGSVPHSEIPSLLAEASIGLAPLRDDEELAYAMPSKVYEYLGHGLPVVATGRGELERFVEDSGGGLHADNDAEEIAAAVRRLLTDDGLRRDSARRGTAHVRENYDRETIASRFSTRLEDVLEGGERG